MGLATSDCCRWRRTQQNGLPFPAWPNLGYPQWPPITPLS